MRRLLYRVGLGLQAIFYVAAGVNHFWHTGMYAAIMPPHYSHPIALVRISGAAEILGGLGLLPRQTRWFAACGIIAMLVLYFDVHVFMAMHPGRFSSIPVWLLYGRIPLQFVLIAWAAVCTERDS